MKRSAIWSMLFTATLFGAGLVFTATPAQAQDIASDPVAVERDDDDGDTGLWGLAGLAGLLGLAGLKRRDHHDRHVTHTTHTTPTTTPRV